MTVTVSAHAGKKHCSSWCKLALMEPAFASYSSTVPPAFSTNVIDNVVVGEDGAGVGGKAGSCKAGGGEAVNGEGDGGDGGGGNWGDGDGGGGEGNGSFCGGGDGRCGEGSGDGDEGNCGGDGVGDGGGGENGGSDGGGGGDGGGDGGGGEGGHTGHCKYSLAKAALPDKAQEMKSLFASFKDDASCRESRVADEMMRDVSRKAGGRC